MDRDKEQQLDQLMERASESALKSLDATVDVEQRLRDVFRAAGVDPDFVKASRAR
jgi:ribosomal protein L1